MTLAEAPARSSPPAVAAAAPLRGAATNLKKPSGGRGVRAMTPGVVLSFVFLALLGISALVPQLIATHNPLTINPGMLAGPSWHNWLGTDEDGRDIFSRIVYGARPAVYLGFGSVGLALGGGSALGLAAGLGNRFVEQLIMRFVDVGLAFPEMLLALIVIAVTGGGSLLSMVLAIGIAGIPSFARLVRAQALTIRRSSYVEAARGLGLRGRTVVFRHVLPNAVRPVLVLATIGVGTATVAGAGLTFIGMGPPPPNPTWGVMLSTAQNFLGQSIWYGIFPGLAISFLVLSVTVIGRWLQHRPQGAGS